MRQKGKTEVSKWLLVYAKQGHQTLVSSCFLAKTALQSKSFSSLKLCFNNIDRIGSLIHDFKNYCEYLDSYSGHFYEIVGIETFCWGACDVNSGLPWKTDHICVINVSQQDKYLEYLRKRRQGQHFMKGRVNWNYCWMVNI